MGGDGPASRTEAHCQQLAPSPSHREADKGQGVVFQLEEVSLLPESGLSSCYMI